MATIISFTVDKITKTYNVGDADARRIIGAMKTTVGLIGDNGTPRPPTDDEAVTWWADGIVATFGDLVTSAAMEEAMKAAKAAQDAAAEIVVTKEDEPLPTKGFIASALSFVGIK